MRGLDEVMQAPHWPGTPRAEIRTPEHPGPANSALCPQAAIVSLALPLLCPRPVWGHTVWQTPLKTLCRPT